VYRRAKAAVEAATRELAGAEAGDGRDDSNRSLAQRLAEAKRNGTAAAAEAKAAAILKKGALSEMEKLKRAATSKGKESSKAEQVTYSPILPDRVSALYYIQQYPVMSLQRHSLRYSSCPIPGCKSTHLAAN
jgi:hypothetical protein